MMRKQFVLNFADADFMLQYIHALEQECPRGVTLPDATHLVKSLERYVKQGTFPAEPEEE